MSNHVIPNPNSTFSPLKHSGIHVRGSILAPINVRSIAEYADIIAKSIKEPITIGRMLKGSIIAYGEPTQADPTAGTLASVSVGLSPDLVDLAENDRFPGFCGVEHGGDFGLLPIDMNPHADNPNDRPVEEIWFSPRLTDPVSPSLPYGGASDSVIRAWSAGEIRLAAMSGYHRQGINQKTGRPRVELRSAGSVDVGVMLSGVVWSGSLEYNPSTFQAMNDPSNDFARVGQFRASCIGTAADIWLADVGLLSVDGDVRGQIRLPSLSETSAVVIGGTLATPPASSSPDFGCDADARTPFLGLSQSEESPRGIQAAADDATENSPYGAIYIRDALGLAGQITLEANNTTAVHDTSRLAGFVRVGGFVLPEPPATTPLPLTFATNLSPAAGVTPETTLPLYQTRAIDLGNGAIGVVPFAVHLADSPAVTGADNIFPPFILPTALRISGLPLRYYGPVVMTVPQPTGTITSRGIGTTGPFLAPNSGQNFTGAATGRTMTLTATQSSQILPLEYQAIPDTFGVQSLVTLPTGLVTRNTLANTAVYYRVGCGFGGNPNPADVTGIGGPPALPDNVVTGDDFNAFIAAFAGGDLFADIVGIGGIGTAPDGLLTGDDFNAFITAFAAGCEQ